MNRAKSPPAKKSGELVDWLTAYGLHDTGPANYANYQGEIVMVKVTATIEPRGQGRYRMVVRNTGGALFIDGSEGGLLHAVDEVIALINRHPEWYVSVSIPLRALLEKVAVPQKLTLVLS